MERAEARRILAQSRVSQLGTGAGRQGQQAHLREPMNPLRVCWDQRVPRSPPSMRKDAPDAAAHAFASLLVETAYVSEAQPNDECPWVLLKRTGPIRLGHIYRKNRNIVSLSILDERARIVGLHRLGIQEQRQECRGDDDLIMALGCGDRKTSVIPSDPSIAASSFFRATPSSKWECVSIH